MDVRIDSQPGSDDDRFEDRTTLGVKKSSRRSRRGRLLDDPAVVSVTPSGAVPLRDTYRRPSSRGCEPSPRRPLVCLGYHGSRHQEPVRLPSQRPKNVVSLRVIEFNEDAVENIERLAPTLRRLDLTGLHLYAVHEDVVSRLVNLQKLDLSFNELHEDSFPDAFRQLTSLIDLAVHYNNIANIPLQWRGLANLSRLKFGHNMITNVDGIGKLKKLQILIMEHNKIETLPKMFHSRLKKVEILHLSNNYLNEISSTVHDMRSLRDIDISSNRLSTLPVEIFMLPRIEVLNANNNQISRIGVIPSRGHGRSPLASIDLSDNLLVKFPDSLLLLTDNLDLARNKIKIVSNAVLKKLDWDTAQQLFLSGNPLVFPPQDVCESGIRSIVHFFQEAKASVKVYQGIKAALLGASGSGKTSLVQSLAEQQSRLTGEYNGGTEGRAQCGVDIHDVMVDGDRDDPLAKALHLSLWDFSGDANSLLPNQLCIQPPMLVILTFNLADYDPDAFDANIGCWIDWCIAITNRLVLLPVGTHADRVPAGQQAAVCQAVYARIAAHVEAHTAAIRQEIRKIDGRAHISAAMSDQLKALLALLRLKTVTYERAVAVSSKTMSGMEELLSAVKFMATDKEAFPHVMRQIPTMWTDVENYIDDRGYSLPVPMLTWSELKDELTAKFGLRNLMPMIMQYLHDTGRVFWFADHASLRAHVVLRPSWLTETLRALFQRDWLTASHRLDENRKQCGISADRFDELTATAAADGVVEPDFLKCIWAHILPPKVADMWMVPLQNLLVQHLQLAYYYNGQPALGRPASGARHGALKGGASCHHRQRLLVPWLRETRQPRECREQHTARCAPGNPRLAAVYRFPRYTPPGLFETLTVRTQKSALRLTPLYHWRGGMCVLLPSHKPVLLYLLRIHHHDDGSACLRLEVCYQHKTAGDMEVETLWSVLLPFLEETEALLATFKGPRVDRHMECPACRALSFTGEWVTPRDLQSLPPGTTKSCDVCKEAINTAYLIQPKERRNLEDLVSQKIENDPTIEEELEEETYK